METKDDITDHSEVVVAFVAEDGTCRTVGATSGFRVLPSCEFLSAETTTIKRAARIARREIQRREGRWQAVLATLPSIRVNTLGDTFEPESEDDYEYKTEFPIRIYLQKQED